MIEIGIVGARGRMGQAIALELAQRDDARAVNVAERMGGPALGCDVLIDFSSPDALSATLAAATASGTALVIGTTGLSEAQHGEIDRAAATIPVMQAANMSLGVALLAHLVRDAAAKLGDDWDIEIAEMHHRHKRDAPSGTALLLGAAAAAGRGIALDEASERGRDGLSAARQSGAIGFAALRGGSVAGDHLVIFAGDGERLQLGHRAESRAIFAKGAVRAALWLHGRGPGRYTMNDMLGLA